MLEENLRCVQVLNKKLTSHSNAGLLVTMFRFFDV